MTLEHCPRAGEGGLDVQDWSSQVAPRGTLSDPNLVLFCGIRCFEHVVEILPSNPDNDGPWNDQCCDAVFLAHPAKNRNISVSKVEICLSAE